MHAFLHHMELAARVGAQIEAIFTRHGIRTEDSLFNPDRGMIAICHTARHGNIALDWSAGYHADGGISFLSITLRIEHPTNPDQVIQQFKLLLALDRGTWHRSTAGQLGFALDGSAGKDLDEARAMEMLEEMARWFTDPTSKLRFSTPLRDE